MVIVSESTGSLLVLSSLIVPFMLICNKMKCVSLPKVVTGKQKQKSTDAPPYHPKRQTCEYSQTFQYSSPAV